MVKGPLPTALAPGEHNVLRLVAVLTFSSAVVAQFAIQGVTLFLRDAGSASGVISLIYVAAVPYTLRFLWGPLVDRYSLGGRDRFSRWLLICQILLGGGLVLWSGLSPHQNAHTIIAVLGIIMVVLGTLQTALGGVLVAGISDANYPKAAALQAGVSAFAGMVLGAGVLYLLGTLGWRTVVWTLIALIALAGIAALSQWRSLSFPAPQTAQPPRFLSQLSIFAVPVARRLLLTSLLINGALVLPYAGKSLLLIDAGYSIATASLIGIVLGNACALVGALTARPLVERWGGLRVLMGLGVMNTVFACLVLGCARDGLDPWEVTGMIFFASFSVFAAYTASRSVLMPLCREGRQATDLASFVGIEAVLFLIIAGGGLSLLDAVGLIPLLGVGAAASILGSIYAARQAI